MTRRPLHITLLVLLTLSLGSLAYAQSIRIVVQPERLPLPYASLAKISPTGERLSFSGERFNKLFVSDLAGTTVSELCPYASVGWGHQWSPNGQLIAVRANHYEELTKKVSLELIDVVNKTMMPVTGILNSRSRLSLPEWTDENSFNYSTIAGITTKQTELDDTTLAINTVEQQEISFKRWSNNALELHDEAEVQRIQPFRQERQILNSTWDPERELSAVEFSGRPSLYVIPEDGEDAILIDEKGEYPSWFGDDFIVYMVTEDDGYKITAANIWIADKEGKMKMNLTEGLSEIALYPSAAKDGTIVFTTESGAVYKMKIEVE